MIYLLQLTWTSLTFHSGGRADFKWEDVKNDAQRENYLGHSLMAPVGRWQQGKDLNWYAKGDGTEEGEMTAAEKRKEEIRKIKEAEEEARCIALGLPPPDKNANLIPLGEGTNEMDDDRPKGIEGEKKKKKRRHRSRNRDRDDKRHRHRRHRSSSRDDGRRHRRHRSSSRDDESRRLKRERSSSREDEGRRHRRHRSMSREDEGRRRRRSTSRNRDVRRPKDRSRSRDRRRDDGRRDADDRSKSTYKADRRHNDRSFSPERRSRYRDDGYPSADASRKRCSMD